MGLTAAANRDELTGKWTVDAGTLVLADQGFAIIDELDKMSKSDRDSLHEPMEQGRIDFAKAGINMILNARATVIAAANPKFGRFNRMKSLPEQVDLPPTLLSRFDLIFIFLDEPEPEYDKKVAEAILGRWYKPEEVTPPYSPEFLQKIIAYARRKIKHIKMSPEAYEKIMDFYVNMRRLVQPSKEGTAPIPITARQLEALIRLSEAHARMHLRDVVTGEDAETVIQLMEWVLRRIAIDEQGNLDVTIIEAGKSAKEISKMEKILGIVKELQVLEDFGAHEEDIIQEAARYGISQGEARELLKKLVEERALYMPRTGH